MVRFFIPNHNQLVVSYLTREVGTRSTPSLVFNLEAVSHLNPLSSSLPSSASSSSSSLSASSSDGQPQTVSLSLAPSPLPHNDLRTHYQLITCIPEWVLVIFSQLFRDHVAKLLSQVESHSLCLSCLPQQTNRKLNIQNNSQQLADHSPIHGHISRIQAQSHNSNLVLDVDDYVDSMDEDVSLDEVEPESLEGGVGRENRPRACGHSPCQRSSPCLPLSPITFTVHGLSHGILKLIIELLSKGTIEVPFTKVDDVKEGCRLLGITSFSLQDVESKEIRRKFAMSSSMKPSKVFRSKSVSHMMFPIRESIEAD